MISIVIMTIVTFFHSCLLFGVLIYPYRNKLCCSRPAAVLTVTLCSVLYTLPFLTRFYDLYSLGYGRIVLSCANIALFSLISARLTGIKFVFLIFTAYIFRNITDSLYSLTRIVYFIFLDDRQFAALIRPIVYLLLVTLFTPGLLRFAEQDLKPCLEYSASKTWYFLWILPFTNYLYFRFFADADYFEPGPDWSARTIFSLLLWLGGTFLTHFILLKMIREASQITALKEQLKYARIITDLQSRESISLQENLAETRKIRHDMRHHMVVLDGYLKAGDNAPARDYIRNLVDSIDQLQPKQYCVNLAVNSIMNYYAEKADGAGVSFSGSVSLREELPLPDTDFCSILGNLMENALEACLRLPPGQESFIDLRLGYAGANMLVLTLKNSFNGELKTLDGKFLSSKRNACGIGTESVLYMVEKYDGVCRFRHSDTVFTVSVLLNPDHLKK